MFAIGLKNCRNFLPLESWRFEKELKKAMRQLSEMTPFIQTTIVKEHDGWPALAFEEQI